MVDLLGVGDTTLNVIPSPIWYALGILVLYADAFGLDLDWLSIPPNFLSGLISPLTEAVLGLSLTGIHLLGIYIVALLALLAVRLS